MDNWIGLKLQYNKKFTAIVVKEDKTHILLQFEDGSHTATPKSHFDERHIIKDNS